MQSPAYAGAEMDGLRGLLEALGGGINDGPCMVEVYFLLQERVRARGVHVTYVCLREGEASFVGVCVSRMPYAVMYAQKLYTVVVYAKSPCLFCICVCLRALVDLYISHTLAVCGVAA